MTKMTLVMTVLFLSVAGSAMASEKKICEKLYAQAEENCTEAMCEEFEEGQCPMDGDFYEGLQICVTEGEFESVLTAYNVKNPRKKVKCKDM